MTLYSLQCAKKLIAYFGLILSISLYIRYNKMPKTLISL